MSKMTRFTMQFLLLLIWTHQVLSATHASFSGFPHGLESSPIFTFLESVYGSGSLGNSSEDVGTPLLLTPYIEEKKLKEAREAAYVNSEHVLPNVDSYAGFLTVNKEFNANLWFWYFPIADQPVEKTPFIVWLQGGPGASSLFGLFTEIGPYTITDDLKLKENKYSWLKNHSLLFIDNPVGAGFSFTDDERGYSTNQTTIGENLYNALQQFLTIFPELRMAPMTIAGESYAGKHIPSLGIQIFRHKQEDEPINLQGLTIGNGFVDPLTLFRQSYVVREIGLVDDSVADKLKYMEESIVKHINNGSMLTAFKYFNSIMGMLQHYSHLQNLYNFLRDDITLQLPYIKFIEQHEIRRALHVGNTRFIGINYLVYSKLKPDFMVSAKIWLEELLDNYRVMVYNGHLDLMVPYHASVNTYNSLNFSDAEKYKNARRRAWFHDRKLAGYYKVAGNLTEVMVRGAGHMVPTDQPAAALGLISAFIRNIPLENDTGDLFRKDKN